MTLPLKTRKDLNRLHHFLIAHCQRTNHPPEECWSGPNATNRPKRLKQDHPADNRNDGHEQGNVT